MSQVQRAVKVITTQDILSDVPEAAEGFPVRKWSIKVCLVGPNGQDIPATVFDKVVYKLHPTFENPNRSFKKPPFKIDEQGWGEFDLAIVFHIAEKGGEHTVLHDLNFQKNRYEVIHNLTFPTNKPALNKLLAESGPVPGYTDAGNASVVSGEKRKAENSVNGPAKTIKRKNKAIEKGTVDLERLSDGLQKLNEDDLLSVVQMVTDNKTNEMYVKNDVEEGEFHMDLYTLPDSLLKSLWDYVKKRVEA
ncbi:transcription initiation factor TFIID subunit 14 [Nadsonia fulvescens var. elongata DSM 6958]|uniref:Transcription initiation factor TFIID subunit 14 n=1 Tax=Nadsonia fulvescens var. elongata DSM 6958 TaxID=857566 RepID=A0A1E3PQ59_9ASCO|nr:transcription initiation factor TFIID subunit 14 [Nadsonia fulvescens var. elongata DSM 6958]